MRSLRFSGEIYVQGRTFFVSGEYIPGCNGSYYDPPEPPDINLLRVTQVSVEGEDPWQEDSALDLVENPDIWDFVEAYDIEFFDAALEYVEDRYDEPEPERAYEKEEF